MKRILLILVCSIGLNLLHAQRMIPSQKGIEISAGVGSLEHPEDNYFASLGWIIYAKNGNYKSFAAEYARELTSYKDLSLPIDTYLLEGSYSLFVMGDSKRNFAINAAMSIIAGYENINKGYLSLPDGSELQDKSEFIYGTAGKLSAETYLSDQFVLIFAGKIKAIWGTSLSRLRPTMGIGLRFNLN